jgi:hypothetical protein
MIGGYTYFYYNIPCELSVQDREESVLYCSTRCQKKGKTPRNPIGRESSVRLLSPAERGNDSKRNMAERLRS